jgi:hypothetical protein
MTQYDVVKLIQLIDKKGRADELHLIKQDGEVVVILFGNVAIDVGYNQAEIEVLPNEGITVRVEDACREIVKLLEAGTAN